VKEFDSNGDDAVLWRLFDKSVEIPTPSGFGVLEEITPILPGRLNWYLNHI
jgi:hypothetical protein